MNLWAAQVRFLRPTELDLAAGELLHKFGRARKKPVRPPIPVDEIIEQYLRLDFGVVDLVHMLGVDDVLGATWFDEGRVRVDERLEGHEGRISFTMAHEVGHWVLHRPQYEADKLNLPLFSREPVTHEPPAVVCRTAERKAPAEWQADQFAARLLMPENFVREAFSVVAARAGQRLSPDTATMADGPLRDLAARVIAVGDFANVSNEAMRIRLSELNLSERDGRGSERLI